MTTIKKILHLSHISTNNCADTSCCVITQQTKSFAVLTCVRIETGTDTSNGHESKNPNYLRIISYSCNHTEKKQEKKHWKRFYFSSFCFFIVRDNELFLTRTSKYSLLKKVSTESEVRH